MDVIYAYPSIITKRKENEKMPKGPLVTEAVEILIASVYDEHPKWTAAKVQRIVSALLRKYNTELLRVRRYRPSQQH